jgi:hypothetical protein
MCEKNSSKVLPLAWTEDQGRDEKIVPYLCEELCKNVGEKPCK